MKVSQRQIVKNMQKSIGKKFMLLDPHKLAGKFGITKRAELIKGRATMIVEVGSVEVPINDNRQIMYLVDFSVPYEKMSDMEKQAVDKFRQIQKSN